MPGRTFKRIFALGVALCVVSVALPAAADEYEDKWAGHPLRIAGYVLHPIGVILDYAFFRPGHWLVHREPARTLFGHDDC